MFNVVCVRWGDKYNEYTEKLREQVRKKQLAEKIEQHGIGIGYQKLGKSNVIK